MVNHVDSREHSTLSRSSYTPSHSLISCQNNADRQRTSGKHYYCNSASMFIYQDTANIVLHNLEPCKEKEDENMKVHKLAQGHRKARSYLHHH